MLVFLKILAEAHCMYTHMHTHMYDIYIYYMYALFVYDIRSGISIDF